MVAHGGHVIATKQRFEKNKFYLCSIRIYRKQLQKENV